MREIKFRAWNKVSKCFFMWDLSFAFNGTDELWGSVEQFTGLHDKNGQPIYEGDIVNFEGWVFFSGIIQSKKDKHEVVKWDEEKTGFFPFNFYDVSYDVYNKPGDCEIIGNIHEKPELLEARP